MLQLGATICSIDNCPHGCTQATGCQGIEILKPQYVIDSLQRAQVEMRAAADHMRRAGIEQHPDELDGAVIIINSWIAGLSTSAVPDGVQNTRGGEQ